VYIGTSAGKKKTKMEKSVIRKIPRPDPQFESSGAHRLNEAEYFDPKPDYEVPELPWDITEVSDADLMEHFSKQLAWQNFFATQVAQAEIEEAEFEAVLKTQEAVVMLNGKKVTEARAERDVDENVLEARSNYMVARAKRKMLQVTMENRERCANLISRELTRRVGREGNSRRSDRWTP
jgi:hypothetical protein